MSTSLNNSWLTTLFSKSKCNNTPRYGLSSVININQIKGIAELYFHCLDFNQVMTRKIEENVTNLSSRKLSKIYHVQIPPISLHWPCQHHKYAGQCKWTLERQVGPYVHYGIGFLKLTETFKNIRDGLIQPFHVRYSRYCYQSDTFFPPPALCRAAVAETIASLFTACCAKLSWAFWLRHLDRTGYTFFCLFWYSILKFWLGLAIGLIPIANPNSGGFTEVLVYKPS